MPERKCDFKIVAFVHGERKEILCNPNHGCLRDFVWSGIGLKTAAAIALGRPNTDGIEAGVKNDCKGQSTSDSPKR